MPVVGREWFLLLPQLHRHRPRFLSTFTQNVRHQRHRVQSKVQSGVVYSFTHVSTPSIFASLGHPLSDQKVGSALVLRPTSFNLSRMLCPLPRTFLIKSRTRLTLTARVHRMLPDKSKACLTLPSAPWQQVQDGAATLGFVLEWVRVYYQPVVIASPLPARQVSCCTVDGMRTVATLTKFLSRRRRSASPL